MSARHYYAFQQCLCRSSAGFTYVGVLLLLAVIALASAATMQGAQLLQQRAAEEQLLLIGEEFQKALASYAAATPAGQNRYPPNLKALLKDPRYPAPKRHLRKLYADPLTGARDWGVIKGNKGIVAVYSLSPRQPIKIGNFPRRFEQFSGASSYENWIFSDTGRFNRRADQLYVRAVERDADVPEG